MFPITTLRQVWCGLKGHDDLQYIRGGRRYLECMVCNRQTPGLQVEEPPRGRRHISRIEARRLYTELLDVEMSLIGGG